MFTIVFAGFIINSGHLIIFLFSHFLTEAKQYLYVTHNKKSAGFTAFFFCTILFQEDIRNSLRYIALHRI